MSGICGLIRLDQDKVDAGLLAAMGQLLAHRGPDGEGQFIESGGRCGLGARHLSVIDPGNDSQPIVIDDGRLSLVCDGRIYNFRQLRTELEQRGVRFKTAGDAEVLLHLYDLHGDEFIQRLDGMFSFALWDARRQRLLIGRDHLGIKPLYLHQSARLLGFASEAKALLQLPGVHAEFNHDVLSDYLHLGYVPAPHSMFKGIRKLLPATMLAVENGQVSEWRYWRLPTRVDRQTSEAEWVECIRAGMNAAVERQLVGAVPTGAFLSGGVDSSAVVASMAKLSAQPVRTYALGFEGGGAERLYNELPYARQVSRLLGTRHEEMIVSPQAASLLPKLLWHLDEPLADSALLTTYLAAEFARGDIKVVLTGMGGDELFGGYRRYLGGYYARKLQLLPRWSRQLMARAAATLPSDRHSKLLNMLRLARGFLASAELSPDERYRTYVQILDRLTVNALMRNRSGGGDALAAAFAQAGNEDELNRLLAVDLDTQLEGDMLNLTDKMTLAVGLENRSPLLDRQLVELAASIPTALKVKNGRLKHLMKSALADVLPADILDRKKRGFGSPMGAWLKRELAPLIAHLLDPKTVRARGLLDPAVVGKLISDHEAARLDGTDSLLALMNLEIWHRIFIDGNSADEVSDELKSLIA